MCRKIHNEYLNYFFQLPEKPQRVVSLVSSATEAMDRMGLHHLLCGVSEYCGRYIDVMELPVVGQYIVADSDQIKDLQPDLVLLTTGIQRKLSERLMQLELPVYNLSLPNSFAGILENIVLLGGLLGEMERARTLVDSLRNRWFSLLGQHRFQRTPKVYVELWLGRHRRAVGGLSYIADLVKIAGGELAYQQVAKGYFENPLTADAKPEADVFVFFHEPEYKVDGVELMKQREWGEHPVMMSTVKMGESMIQDGPSLLDSAAWLYRRMKEVYGA